MNFLSVNNSEVQAVEKSFENIAATLFANYVIHVNENLYRLLDIEFYYFSPVIFEDPYIHKREIQKETGKWYFHESGIDITFGETGNYGGILIRGVGKLLKNGQEEIISKEIHGPLNVTKELTTNFHSAFNSLPNKFALEPAKKDVASEILVIKTNRLGLSLHPKDKDGLYQQKAYRFVGLLPERGSHKFKDKERVVKDAVKQGQLSEEVGTKILGYNTIF